MTPSRVDVEEELRAFEAGEIDPAKFSHHEHVRLGFEMLCAHPFGETVTRFARGLRHLTRKVARPQLYHETITVAFLALIAERRAKTSCPYWDDFIRQNSDLLDKDVLLGWYSPEQLQSEPARRTFCLPAPGRSPQFTS
ncbi:MAG: hypothetical protein M3119_04745 [Verrucomicrobiota bacterium]|nr:hypothetical protein [Verrucomicrobiota bacterium]MDQ6939447.1 hypothetical protein [Verrucomicrobiota bacterium]